VQSSGQIITTNKQDPVFLQVRYPSCRPTNSVKALKGKILHPIDLLTPSSPWGHPALSLTTNSSWIPWGEGCHASHQPSDASTPNTRNLWYCQHLNDLISHHAAAVLLVGEICFIVPDQSSQL